jgi:hypothetical protein
MGGAAARKGAPRRRAKPGFARHRCTRARAAPAAPDAPRLTPRARSRRAPRAAAAAAMATVAPAKPGAATILVIAGQDTPELSVLEKLPPGARCGGMGVGAFLGGSGFAQPAPAA